MLSIPKQLWQFLQEKKSYIFELALLAFIGIGVWRTGWNQAQVGFIENGFYTEYSLPDPPGAFKYRIIPIFIERVLDSLLPISYVTVTVTLTTGFLVLAAFFLTRYLQDLEYEYPVIGGILLLAWYPMYSWEYLTLCDGMALALLFLAFWRDDDRVSVLCGVLLGGIREFAVGFLFLFELWRKRTKRGLITVIIGLGVYFTIRLVLGGDPPLLFPWYWRAEHVGVFKAVFLIVIGFVPVVFFYVLSYLITDRQGIIGSWWVIVLATAVLLMLAQPNEVRLFLPYWIFFAPALMNLIRYYRGNTNASSQSKTDIEDTQDYLLANPE